MKIVITAFDGCMASAVHGILDTMAIARQLAEVTSGGGFLDHAVSVATADGRPAVGYGGLRIDAALSHAEAAGADVLIVPPIMADIETTLAVQLPLVGFLASHAPSARLVGSACTGAFLLAEAGLLTNRTITTNPAFAALFRARYPTVQLALEEKIVAGQQLVLAGSTTAYLDLAVHLVARLGSPELALATARALSIDLNPGSQRLYQVFVAPRDHGDERVHAVQNRIEHDHAKTLSAAALGRECGLSLRSLTRRFRAATGMSPAEYHRRVRIETAKRMLEAGNQSLEQIAISVGFSESQAFQRAFRIIAGCTPGAYRSRFGLGAAQRFA
ncbi:GlxA family transcriptional regulator [Phenylobacterium sp.]|uniref:GlxA family transcriptional regulator n=1 Tax=Phenylobacterium sp. TaxID=1871053 RepID=UPI002FC8D089